MWRHANKESGMTDHGVKWDVLRSREPCTSEREGREFVNRKGRHKPLLKVKWQVVGSWCVWLMEKCVLGCVLMNPRRTRFGVVSGLIPVQVQDVIILALGRCLVMRVLFHRLLPHA